jgi:hypothetical protein
MFRGYIVLTKITLLWAAISIIGCCFATSYKEPDRPNYVRGWKEQELHGVRYLGEFLLQKGEQISNDKVIIKFEDIIPPEKCAEPESILSQPRAIIHFISPKDSQLLCSQDVGVGSIRFDCTEKIDFGITGIHLKAISLKEQWIQIEFSSIK